MKKIAGIVVLILILISLLLSNVFAVNETSDNEIVPGRVLIILVADIPEDVSYESLLPELDIDYIKGSAKYSNGETFLSVQLKENTEQAVYDAIEALKDNDYVKGADVCGIGWLDDYETYVPSFYDEVDFDDKLSEEDYDRVYNEANYERNFVAGSVIVVFKKGVPENTDFVRLLPEIVINIKESEIIGTIGSRVFMTLMLTEETREATISAINLLKVNEYVHSAEPNYIYEILEPVLKGDANCDGIVANDDLVLVARHIVGLEEFNGNQRVNADIDIDQNITNTDLISIAKMIVGAE